MKTNCGKGKKLLIEFIVKKHAEEFYHMLKRDEEIREKIYCMTGDDSIFERKKIIKEVKKKEKAVILVATQVVEAGVDIDMDIGYKNIGRMDSEEQFLGRINRSYTAGRKGLVYFFELDMPGEIYKKDIRSEWEFLIKQPDIWEMLRNKDFDSYYKRILCCLKNNYGREIEQKFLPEKVGVLDFPGVKEQMKLIEEDCYNISVYLGREITDEENGGIMDGRQIWEEYRELLQNDTMGYAEKRVKLSELMVKMNCFIYPVSKRITICFDEQIGELFYIADGEKYFQDGRLGKELLDEMFV